MPSQPVAVKPPQPTAPKPPAPAAAKPAAPVKLRGVVLSWQRMDSDEIDRAIISVPVGVSGPHGEIERLRGRLTSAHQRGEHDAKEAIRQAVAATAPKDTRGDSRRVLNGIENDLRSMRDRRGTLRRRLADKLRGCDDPAGIERKLSDLEQAMRRLKSRAELLKAEIAKAETTYGPAAAAARYEAVQRVLKQLRPALREKTDALTAELGDAVMSRLAELLEVRAALAVLDEAAIYPAPPLPPATGVKPMSMGEIYQQAADAEAMDMIRRLPAPTAEAPV